MAQNLSPEDVLHDLEQYARRLIKRATKLHEDSARGSEMARVYIDMRALMDAMSDIWSDLTEVRDKLAQEWIPEAFHAEDVKTITLKEGYRVTIQGLVRASTRNMERGIQWMKEHGYEDVPKLTINASTLAAIARTLAEKNQELPDEIFNVYFGSNTSVTKLGS